MQNEKNLIEIKNFYVKKLGTARLNKVNNKTI